MFPRCELDDSLALRSFDNIDVLNGISATERHILLAQLMNQFVADLLIEKLQRTRTLIDDRHRHAESSEHRSVFDTDDSGSNHRESSRKMLQGHNVVGGDYGLPVRLNAPRLARTGAYRNQNVVRREPPEASRRVHQYGVGVDKRRTPLHEVDVVSPQRLDDGLHLALHDAPDLPDQLLHGWTERRNIHIDIRAVQVRGSVQALNGLPKSFGGNRAGLDTDAADCPLLFDDDGFLSQLCGLNRGPLARRSTANANEVVLITLQHRCLSMIMNLLAILAASKFNLPQIGPAQHPRARLQKAKTAGSALTRRPMAHEVRE